MVDECGATQVLCWAERAGAGRSGLVLGGAGWCCAEWDDWVVVTRTLRLRKPETANVRISIEILAGPEWPETASAKPATTSGPHARNSGSPAIGSGSSSSPGVVFDVVDELGPKRRAGVWGNWPVVGANWRAEVCGGSGGAGSVLFGRRFWCDISTPWVVKRVGAFVVQHTATVVDH